MKLRFICIIAVLVCIFSITVSADESKIFEIELSKDYNVLYLGEDAAPMAKKLNMKPKELKNYMAENGVLMLAVSKDKSRQIRIIEEQTEFSKLAEDISAMDKTSLNEFAQIVTADNNTEFSYVNNNNRKYIKFSDTLTDSGGSYVMTQYVTICGGKIYRYCFYNSGKTEIAEADETFNNFKLLGFEEKKLPEWFSIVFVLGIAVFAAISIALFVGIIREKRLEKAKVTEAQLPETVEVQGEMQEKEE